MTAATGNGTRPGRPRRPRLAFEPVWALLGSRNVTEAAAQLGKHRTQVQRMLNDGLTPEAADEIATRLGVHYLQLWPEAESLAMHERTGRPARQDGHTPDTDPDDGDSSGGGPGGSSSGDGIVWCDPPPSPPSWSALAGLRRGPRSTESTPRAVGPHRHLPGPVVGEHRQDASHQTPPRLRVHRQTDRRHARPAVGAVGPLGRPAARDRTVTGR